MAPTQELQTPDRRLNRRLDSWKEIAAFFDRDERTVKRWEKEKALPVHRLPGGSRSRIFAFSQELTQWMHSAVAPPEESASEGLLVDAPLHDEADSSVSKPTMAGEVSAEVSALPPAKRRWILFAWGAVLAALALAVGLAVAYRRHVSILSRSQQASAAALAAKNTLNPHIDREAEQFYLQGRYYWNRRTPADLTTAVDYFTQAIVRDPTYSPAYVGLADCYNLLREFATMPANQAYPRALAAATKAVELDPRSAEAHASLAFVTFYWKWDMVSAEGEFRRAIELNPNYSTAHHWYATFLMALGRYPEALSEIDRAQQLDPASTAVLADKALILFSQGQIDDAAALLKQIETSQPGFFSTHKYLSYIYLAKRDYPNFLAEGMEAATLMHDERELAVMRAAEEGFKSGGERGMLQAILRMQENFFDQGQMSAFSVADTSARLGNNDQALHYLQIAYERHDPTFLGIREDRSFSPLLSNSAFRKLLAEAGLPPLSQEPIAIR